MTANGHGLLLCWNLLNVQPGAEADWKTEVEVNNKSSFIFFSPDKSR